MNKRILKLAVPNIISNITIPMLGIIDLGLMGHMGSESYIGAIALGTMIFNFLYWAFAFLRMGTSGFTAQAYGEKNTPEQAYNLFRALLAGGIGAVLLIILQIPIEKASFYLINGSSEVETLAREYFYIRIWAAPATISLFAFTGWFIGMQNAKIPMIISIVINILNIAFNLLFIFVFGMKSDGVALGTVLAQYSGLLMAIYFLFKKYRNVFHHLNWKHILDVHALNRFFKVNSDIIVRTFCIIGVFTFFTSKSASMDDTLLAVNSLLLQFLMFFSYFIDGFAYAGEALIGRYLGAKDLINFKLAIKKLFHWGIGLAAAYTLIYFVSGSFILKILTNNITVLNQSESYMIWVVLIPVASFATFIWDGIYIGSTASKAMRNTMLASTFLLFVPIYFFLMPIWGNHALWLSMLLFMAGRGVFQTIIAPKSIYRLIKSEE
ncbi:MATE family efflux transporter [Puteibacter caeruleilacunae]|nr:MATE family efflux transporter [Puteibacter caeruleilacunae]